MELSELFAGRDIDLAAVQERLGLVAEEVGLPLTPRSRTYNSRHAQELGKYAERIGLLDTYQKSVYRAYFVEGRNIALWEELLPAAERAGLDPQECRRVLEEGLCAKEVGDDWRRTAALGINGVPAFLCGDRRLVGFRPYRDLEALVLGQGQNSTR
ncbi:hypothetical protein GMSM_38880 [Geomonas sp. Red276]